MRHHRLPLIQTVLMLSLAAIVVFPSSVNAHLTNSFYAQVWSPTDLQVDWSFISGQGWPSEGYKDRLRDAAAHWNSQGGSNLKFAGKPEYAPFPSNPPCDLTINFREMAFTGQR